MGFDMNFLPGKMVRWKDRRFLVVDCQDMQTVLVQEPGRRKLTRIPVSELSPDVRPDGEAFKPPSLISLPAEAWRAALDQLASIRPLLDMDPKVRTLADVKKVADALGKHPSTIYRWIEEYGRTGRVSVFLRKPRSDQGALRIPEAVEAIIATAIKTKYLVGEKPDMVAVIEEVQLQCRKANQPRPHPNTVRRRIAMVSDREKLRKREGKKAVDEKYEPRLGHFPGADYPLAVVQIDHTPMDVIVVDEEDREPINRPYLTIVIDVFSRMVLGFAIYLEKPSAFMSGLAIAHAVLPKEDWLAEMRLKSIQWDCWGKFRKLHCDNAKEFRGTVIGRACEEHDILVEHRPVRTPHFGGHVERGFRTFMKRVHRLKGTTFSDIEERLDYDSSGRAIMTRAELERWFTVYIAKYYPNKYHRGIEDTPLARYRAGILGTDGHMGIGLPEPVQSPERFMLDFMPYQERTVQDYGLLINHVFYYDDALRRWICAADPLESEKARKFVVRYNPRKMHEVYFLDPDDNEYITIPYRDRSHPPASYWEIAKAAEKVRQKGYTHVNEDLIFEAIEEMRQIEDEAERRTKSARREREKRKHPPVMPVKVGSESTRPPRPTPQGSSSSATHTAEEADEATTVQPFAGIVEPD